MNALGINRRANRQHNPSRRQQIIKLLYNFSKFLSFSERNRKPKHIHIPNIKNHSKSYFALNTNAFIHTCCIHTAKSNNMMVVAIKIRINCNINFDWMFLSNKDRVMFSVCSLFFTDLIHFLILANMYRSNITTNISNINSFHIHINVRNFPSRHNLKVTRVCRKNCNKSQITKILHSRAIR